MMSSFLGARHHHNWKNTIKNQFFLQFCMELQEPSLEKWGDCFQQSDLRCHHIVLCLFSPSLLAPTGTLLVIVSFFVFPAGHFLRFLFLRIECRLIIIDPGHLFLSYALLFSLFSLVSLSFLSLVSLFFSCFSLLFLSFYLSFSLFFSLYFSLFFSFYLFFLVVLIISTVRDDPQDQIVFLF